MVKLSLVKENNNKNNIGSCITTWNYLQKDETIDDCSSLFISSYKSHTFDIGLLHKFKNLQRDKKFKLLLWRLFIYEVNWQKIPFLI